MKLVTYKVSTPLGPFERIGALLQENKIIDLNLGYASYLREAGEETRLYEAAALRIPPDMIEYFKGGELSRKAAKQTIDYVSDTMQKGGPSTGPGGEKIVYQVDEVKLMAPVPRPHIIRDYFTYEDHGKDKLPIKPAIWYTYPSAFKGNPASVIGPDEPIARPDYCTQLDCEMEIGLIIGKEGRNISIEDADEYVAGYTIFNDCSARNIHELEMNGCYKSKDFCYVFGPCIVTPDEIDYKNLKATLRVDGEVWYEGNTGRNRHFFSPELIAFASDNETVCPGDLLGSGTIGGGCSVDIGKWLEPGMVLEMEIEGIGVLRNPIVQGEPEQGYVKNGLPGHLKPKKAS